MATTTPNYGWDVPTSTDYVKDGATAIETLGDDIDATLYTALGGAYPGLRLVKKQTVGTGVVSVTVTGAFNATYENYRIIFSGSTGTAAGMNIAMTLGSTSSGYNFAGYYLQYGTATLNPESSINQGNWPRVFRGGTGNINGAVELYDPFLTKKTAFSSNPIGTETTDITGIHSGFLNDTTSYTAFTLTTNAGTMTGGTIYIYGYGIS